MQLRAQQKECKMNAQIDKLQVLLKLVYVSETSWEAVFWTFFPEILIQALSLVLGTLK